MKDSINAHIVEIRKKIEISAEKSGRKSKDILLLAVTKTIPADTIKIALENGITAIGENKVQEVLAKYDKLPNAQFHLIGYLQTNKVKYIVDKVKLIHSVDSFKLAKEINKQSQKRDLVSDVLVEVNIAGEESKFGVKPSDCWTLLKDMEQFSNIRVKGLMTVAPFTADPEENRGYFRKMKQLFVDISGKTLNNMCMEHLSMGMSGDFGVAIEEGATIVRIGTKIFGERTVIQ